MARNFEKLSSEAVNSMLDDKVYAVRVNGPKPCPWCAERQGQVINIWDVINGIVDHEFGQCSYLYLSADDELLDGSEKKVLVSGVEILVLPVPDETEDDLPDAVPDDSELDDDK